MINSKRRQILFTAFMLMLIAGITFLVFSNTLKADFIYNWDDNLNVTNNQNIRDFSVEGISRLFDPQANISEPRLTLFSFALEYRYYSLNPAPYHLHNLLLHIANVLLLFFLVKVISGKRNIAVLTALLFAIHPMHVESVSWVTGRKDLLFSLFYMLSMLSYIAAIRRKPRLLFLLAALVFGVISLLSKIQALSLPLTWILLDIFYRRKFSPDSLMEKVLLFVLLLYNHFSVPQLITPFAVYGFLIVYPRFRGSFRRFRLAGWLRLRLKTFAYPLIFLTWSLILFFALRRVLLWDEHITNAKIWLLASGLTIILLYNMYYHLLKDNVVAWKPGLRWLWPALALVLLVGPLLLFTGFPELNLWTTDFRLSFSPADRIFMAAYSFSYYFLRVFYPFNTSPIQPYPDDNGLLPVIYYVSILLPLILMALTVWSYRKYREKLPRTTFFGAAFFLVNILMVLHFFSIEGRVIVADRYAYLAYAGVFLAIVLLGEKSFHQIRKNGRIVLLSLAGIVLILFSVYTYQRNFVWQNGITLFNEVIRHYPDYELAYINRGTLYLNKQKNKEAISDFNKAIHLDEEREITYYNRALAYYNLGQFDSAYADCSRTIRYNSLFFDAWYLRGFLKNKSGNFAGAIADYNQVIYLSPSHKLAWYNRGNARKNLGDLKGALLDYQQTIHLDSAFAMAYNAAGVTLFFMGDYRGSLNYYDQAIKKNPGEGNFLFNRGLSELKLGLTEAACRDFRAAWGLGYSESKNLIDQHCH